MEVQKFLWLRSQLGQVANASLPCEHLIYLLESARKNLKVKKYDLCKFNYAEAYSGSHCFSETKLGLEQSNGAISSIHESINSTGAKQMKLHFPNV
jgi:hypothetical protein